jgi:hypothetical protein
MMGAALANRGIPDVARRGRLAWRSPTAWAERSTQTATWSNVEVPPPSAAASTDEVGSPAATVATTWLQPVVDRLNHLLQLQDGWDGQGTLGITLEVADKTLETLVLIATENTRPPSISPSQDGSLQLAWYAREFELEIEVPRSGNVTASLYRRAVDQDFELPLTSPQLSEVIMQLTAD